MQTEPQQTLHFRNSFSSPTTLMSKSFEGGNTTAILNGNIYVAANVIAGDIVNVMRLVMPMIKYYNDNAISTVFVMLT